MYGAYHHITVLGKESAECDQTYDVVGSLCENNDKFAIDRKLPRIDRGDLLVIHDTALVYDAFEQLLAKRTPIMAIVDEFGGMEGVMTLEDVLETLLGLEILDEGDEVADMQALARKLWKKRAKEMGLEVEDK